MSWFKRIREGITTKTTDKKETPDGLWHKCKMCGTTVTATDLADNLWVCPTCDHHERINSLEYFTFLFDNGEAEELFTNFSSYDYLHFKDLKTYKKRLEEAADKTDVNDAISVAAGNLEKMPLVIACMNFNFIGGSMGSVVGEKIAEAVDFCIEHNTPLLIISKTGGARMMESAFSLMQMAKTAAKLSQLATARLPFISLLTDPTTGGVTASYAMLGDLNIAEPKALIGFAGPRVIKETIKRDLPEGFQRSEFLLEKGFLDFIVHRRDLKQQLATALRMVHA